MNSRGTGEGNEQTLRFIQACIEAGRYLFTEHALTKHPVDEGFEAGDALDAIMEGTIIQGYEQESRCLVCGPASALELDVNYIGNFIHCVVRYDRVDRIVIITMYRPRSSEWINQFTRRPQPD